MNKRIESVSNVPSCALAIVPVFRSPVSMEYADNRLSTLRCRDVQHLLSGIRGSLIRSVMMLSSCTAAGKS